MLKSLRKFLSELTSDLYGGEVLLNGYLSIFVLTFFLSFEYGHDFKNENHFKRLICNR